MSIFVVTESPGYTDGTVSPTSCAEYKQKQQAMVHLCVYAGGRPVLPLLVGHQEAKGALLVGLLYHEQLLLRAVLLHLHPAGRRHGHQQGR